MITKVEVQSERRRAPVPVEPWRVVLVGWQRLHVRVSGHPLLPIPPLALRWASSRRVYVILRWAVLAVGGAQHAEEARGQALARRLIQMICMHTRLRNTRSDARLGEPRVCKGYAGASRDDRARGTARRTFRIARGLLHDGLDL